VFNSIWDCKELIEEQLIDYIRTTVVHARGITHLRRIADLASLYQVRTGGHGATDLSPVCMGAALHFDTWVPNFGVREYMPTQSKCSLSLGMIIGSNVGLCFVVNRLGAAGSPNFEISPQQFQALGPIVHCASHQASVETYQLATVRNGQRQQIGVGNLRRAQQVLRRDIFALHNADTVTPKLMARLISQSFQDLRNRSGRAWGVRVTRLP
jgi:Enolase C-terminal domain-like